MKNRIEKLVLVMASVLFVFGLQSASAEVKELDLAGEWRLENATNAAFTCPIAVPGGVHSALLAAGLMKDPFWGGNEVEAQWVAKESWAVERAFDVPEKILARRTVILRLEDCDTFCTIYINGSRVARTSNRFARWDFDVKSLLKPGRNTIRGVFESAWQVADEKAKTQDGKCHMSNVPWATNQALIRKPACHAGWDWGPAQMIAGFCGTVKLIGSDGDRIDYIYTDQKWSSDLKHCKLTVTAEFEGGGVEKRTIEIDNPPLWWPNGAGAQPLYEYTVEFRGQKVTRRIGLRKLEVDRTGGGMAFKVNNRMLFMKGANWIPCDAFENRQTPERYRDLLESAAAANMNMIRLWGGGQYEKDCFYEICDELGLLVWHDMMFSCAVYPGDDAFLADVEREYAHQIRRLRDYASIAMWCGDNECVGALNWFGDPDSIKEKNRRNLEKRHAVTDKAVHRYDPSRMFWPSSPCAGPGDYADAWHDDSKGDMHNWTVWHENKSFDNYYKFRPRFCSEFGYQSFPSREVALTFCSEEDLNPTAPDFEWHQKNAGGNQRILETMARYFRFPQGTDAILYLSQVQQAIAIKTAVEGWRAQRPRCYGTLYWQLNDLWPVSSWSSIEYGGKWKHLHHHARRFFAPVAAVGLPEGKIAALNDTAVVQKGTLLTEYWGFDGKLLRSERTAVELAPDSVTQVAKYEKMDNAFVHFTLETQAGRHENDWFFDFFKKYDIRNAAVSVSVDGFKVKLLSDVPAFFVWLNATGIPGEFSDNSLTLLPGRPVVVEFKPKGTVDADAFRRALSVYDLSKTFSRPRRPAAGDIFQRAIDAAAEAGGGRVTIPAGRHLTRGLILRSNVELHLEKGAVLEASSRASDYRRVTLPHSEGAWMAVVMALDAENVSITGEGTIDGRGGDWPTPGRGSSEGTRPRGLFFSNCRNVNLSDFTLRDAACWGIVFKCCDGVTARGVKVDSQANANNDGFDIEAKNVLIEDCDVDSGDDAYVLKSNDPSFTVENVVIRRCVARSSCNFFKLGTASHGTMRNIRFEDNRCEAPRRSFVSSYDKRDWGRPLAGEEWYYANRIYGWPNGPDSLAGMAAVAIECVDGGRVENVTVDGLEATGVMTPIFVRGGKRMKRGGMPDAKPGDQYVLKDIVIRNLRAVAESSVASSITGVEGCRPANVLLENVDIVCKSENGKYVANDVPEHAGRYPEANLFGFTPAWGLYIRHADDVVLKNVSFRLADGRRDARRMVVREDCR